VDGERNTVSGKTELLTDALELPGGETNRDDGLPIEPARPQAAPTDTANTLRQLIRFQTYGQRPAEPESDTAEQWPALLFSYRELSRIRHDFPLLQLHGETDEIARPLSEHIDELFTRLGTDGDEGERLKRHLYRLESAIRSLAEARTGGELTELWDQAAATLLSAGDLRAEQKQRLQTNLMVARQALQQDGTVLSCGADVPGRLLESSMALHWRRRSEGWREALAALIAGLKSILRADFDRSPAAKTAEHLRESAGTEDDMDFQAMSDILSAVPLGERLPHARRQRITSALSVMLEVEAVFGASLNNTQPFCIAPIRDDVAAGVQGYRDRMQIMTAFFKSVQIARLEVENRYREEIHDDYFAQFDESFLSDEERALCPPVLVHLRPEYVTESGAGAVLQAMASGLPLKLLIEIDDLCPDGLNKSTASAGWTARLATMAMALHDVYVLQGLVSRPLRLQSAFLDGLDYPGPALFTVYTGGRHSRLPAYLDAEAAAESRAFPTFQFDPGQGDTQAERIDVLENSQPERDWPREAFRYRTPADDEETLELAFTLADFLFCDTHLTEHFWCLRPAMWHADMLPLQEYLHLDPASAAARIPYLTTVDGTGQTGRVVMTHWLVSSVMQTARRWRGLQESGGVNNSFALNLLAEEKQRLEDEKAREVAAVEAQYAGKLEQDIAALTREIVDRIAAQLISGAATDVPLAPAIAAAARTTSAEPAPVVDREPATDQPAASEPAETDEVEDDEPLSFDEPYIDTPLCTSCNDCTDLYPNLFAYDENKQAYIKDPKGGTYRELVLGAELCPVCIIHPGKPSNPDEPDLEDWVKRAVPFN
jgi:ferredoxin